MASGRTSSERVPEPETTPMPSDSGVAHVRPRCVWGVLGLLGLALVVRVGVVVATRHARPLFDAGSYVSIGQSIASGHGFGPSQWAHGPTAHHPPGYPVFVGAVFSVFGHSLLSLRLIECVLGVFSVAGLGFIAFRVWGASAAVISMALAAVYLPLAISGTSMVSEAIFVPLAMGSIAAALRAIDRGGSLPWLGISGFLAGLAWLARDNGVVLLLPLLLLASGLVRHSAYPLIAVAKATPKRRLAAVTVVVAAFATPVVPWTIRNAYVMHAFVPVSTESWYTLAAEYNNLSLQHPGQAYDPGVTSTYGRFFPQTGEFVRKATLSEPQVDRAVRGPVLRFIGAHLSFVLRAALANLKRMASPVPDAEQPGSGLKSGIAFYLLASLFAFGLLTRSVHRTPLWLWLAGAVMLLPVLFTATSLRIRAPVDPFIILIASAGISAAGSRVHTRATRRDRFRTQAA